MKKYFLLLAMALPMFMTTSCKDDETEIKPEQEKEFTRFTDGVEYMNAKLFYTDENGQVTGVAVGEFVQPNEPTTAYVGVESLEEAQSLASSLFPANSAVKVADNITFTLTDTLGVKQGQAHYIPCNTGADYGRLIFDETLGVDKNLLTSIVFIDNALWPDNAPVKKSAFSAGNIYKCSKKIAISSVGGETTNYYQANFICTRTPSNGNAGILFADLNHSTYQRRFLIQPESHVESCITQYPSTYWMQELSKDLNGANQIYWKQIAACANTTVKTIKQRWYFTHHVDDLKVTVCTLGNWSTSTDEVPWFEEHNYNASVLYKFTINTDGTTNIKLDGAGCWTSKQTEISLSDLTIDRELMSVALEKNPNE